MAKFDLLNYASVNERIALFVSEFPDGSIQTFVRHIDGPEIVMEARVFRTPLDVEKGAYSSGFAREVEGKSNVNSTSHVENCETSAIGRALANMGYGVSKERASRSEMIKVARMNREMDTFVQFIADVGKDLPDDATALIKGKEVVLKQFIRENWEAITEQFVLARAVTEALEAVMGTKLEVSNAA